MCDIPLDHAVPATRLLSGAPTGASATAAIPSATASSVVHVTVFENIPIGETGAPVQPVVNLDNQGLPAALLAPLTLTLVCLSVPTSLARSRLQCLTRQMGSSMSPRSVSSAAPSSLVRNGIWRYSLGTSSIPISCCATGPSGGCIP